MNSISKHCCNNNHKSQSVLSHCCFSPQVCFIRDFLPAPNDNLDQCISTFLMQITEHRVRLVIVSSKHLWNISWLTSVNSVQTVVTRQFLQAELRSRNYFRLILAVAAMWRLGSCVQWEQETADTGENGSCHGCMVTTVTWAVNTDCWSSVWGGQWS